LTEYLLDVHTRVNSFAYCVSPSQPLCRTMCSYSALALYILSFTACSLLVCQFFYLALHSRPTFPLELVSLWPRPQSRVFQLQSSLPFRSQRSHSKRVHFEWKHFLPNFFTLWFDAHPKGASPPQICPRKTRLHKMSSLSCLSRLRGRNIMLLSYES